MNIEVIFKWVLSMTLGGSAAIFVFAILGKIFKEYLSARARYYIWIIVLFCFMVPWYVLLSKKSGRVLNQSVTLDNNSYITSKLSNNSALNLQLIENTAQGGALTALPYKNISYFNPEKFVEFIGYVWLVGAIVFLHGF